MKIMNVNNRILLYAGTLALPIGEFLSYLGKIAYPDGLPLIKKITGAITGICLYYISIKIVKKYLI